MIEELGTAKVRDREDVLNEQSGSMSNSTHHSSVSAGS